MSEVERPPQIPKWLLNLQIFLLRRKLMGPMNRQLMVISTTGRKTGQQRSVPIGFAPDGRDFLAFNIGGRANWYQNVLANPRVTLEVNGEKIQARGEPMQTREQLHDTLEVYKRERPEMFDRFLKVPSTTPTDEMIDRMGDRVVFMRFHRL